jgi:1,4-dihydroxy-2-naphthoate octaprenyltransferase
MGRIWKYVIATRPWSFSMSVISVSVGTLLAAEKGPVLWGWFALTAVGMVLFHGAANVVNDYFDVRYKVDQPDSPTAKYRPHPLLSGMLTPRQLLVEVFVLYALTLGIGLVLTFARSPLLLLIGFVGFLVSLFYTAGPVRYKYRALGEFSVFLVWGPLVVQGAYAVQRQTLSLKALFVSIPFGVLVALVLLANNMRDIQYDSRQGIKTISILVGRAWSFRLYAALIATAYLFLAGMVAGGLLSPWGLLVFLSAPRAVSLLKSFKRSIPEDADAVTAQVDTLFGLLLIVSLILNKVIPL